MDREKWEALKALARPEPQTVAREELPLVHDKKGRVVGSINRAYRRSAQGRFRGAAAGSPKAARLTPADRDGRSAAVTGNREARRRALKAERTRRAENTEATS
jgi:hypothetical protein